MTLAICPGITPAIDTDQAFCRQGEVRKRRAGADWNEI